MNHTCICKTFTAKDRSDFKKTIHKALEILNKKNFSLIIHGASFPSLKEQDTGFGTYNSEGGRKFIEFINNLGFNGIQLGPDGMTKGVDSSPYIGTMFSNNPLFIDLYQLTTPEFGEILDKELFARIVANNPAKNNRSAYSYVYKEQNKALREAFKTFKAKLSEDDETIKKLNKKFDKFVKENALWLEKDAFYEALCVKHGNDYWPVWEDELDKKLFCPDNEFSQEIIDERIKEIKKIFGEEIKFYQFVQFISFLQKQNTAKFALKQNMKTIADCQVAFSDRDYWANQAYFMKDYFLGCPPDCFSVDGQAWGFPVMNPDKLFNPDGSLAQGGKVLKARFEKMFDENPGGIRIDHIIGLIDPYVYRKGFMPKPEEGASRLYSSPEHKILGKYAIPTKENLNPEVGPENEKRIINLTNKQIKQYAQILEKVVIQTAEEKGIGKESIICEDLGTITNPVLEVMEKLGLSGLRVTSFVDPEDEEHPYRIKNAEPRHWVMIGSHDNDPLVSWVNELYEQKTIDQHAQILAEDLKPSKLEEFKQELINNRKSFIKAKFAELFASSAENVQIFFADLFGMPERYNRPGTAGDENWSLRVPQKYECFYYEQVAAGEALNLPEALILAIESKGNKFVFKHQELVKKLRKYAEIFSNK
ncbi:MAG TPA: 4-alpha-glucanotransferase [Candidatus Gastranaerophilales bacterium]|nr:4-alpha-glucanotransferase [Candidatus Gastranaerophilales bacterium]